jgi:hypothetical protein
VKEDKMANKMLTINERAEMMKKMQEMLMKAHYESLQKEELLYDLAQKTPVCFRNTEWESDMDKTTRIEWRFDMDKTTHIEKRNWEFVVRSQDMVLLDDMLQYISKEDPLGVMFPDNKKTVIIILVHDSIISKASICGIPIAEKFNVKSATIKYVADVSIYVTYNSISVEELKEWVREVKQAKWPSEYKEVKYTAVIPKI